MTTLTDRPHAALIVIDVQNGVVADAHDREQVLANVRTAVQRARAADVSVIWVQDAAENRTHGSEAWQIVPELDPGPAEPRVEKHYGDAFEDTDLEEVLATRGVGRLYLAGAQTDACVRSTLHGAFTRGYDTILISDAHTTEDLSAWGAPTPDKVIAHTNLYGQYQSAPGRDAASSPPRRRSATGSRVGPNEETRPGFIMSGMAGSTARMSADDAARYDAMMLRLERRFFADTRSWVCRRARGDVLEIAVGTGLNLPYYPDRIRITGVDHNPEILDFARRRATTIGREISLGHGDAMALPFAQESFDTVVCTFALCGCPTTRSPSRKRYGCSARVAVCCWPSTSSPPFPWCGRAAPPLRR